MKVEIPTEQSSTKFKILVKLTKQELTSNSLAKEINMSVSNTYVQCERMNQEGYLNKIEGKYSTNYKKITSYFLDILEQDIGHVLIKNLKNVVTKEEYQKCKDNVYLIKLTEYFLLSLGESFYTTSDHVPTIYKQLKMHLSEITLNQSYLKWLTLLFELYKTQFKYQSSELNKIEASGIEESFINEFILENKDNELYYKFLNIVDFSAIRFIINYKGLTSSYMKALLKHKNEKLYKKYNGFYPTMIDF